MLDIDHFKNCNDFYGHDAGDEVLKQTAGLLKRGARAGDLVCRFGGEEFLVLCPSADEETARQTADRLLTAVESSEIQIAESALRITISAGVAAHGEHTDTAEDLLKCADQALYLAKNGGRNRVVVYTGGLPHPESAPAVRV